MSTSNQPGMKIHDLPGDPGRQQKRKRIGRGTGSGHGKTSGKGHKGHKARSGAGKKVGHEGGQIPLQRRLPKFGFTNAFRVEYEVVNLTAIDAAFEAGAVVDEAALRKARLVRASKPVKILGTGELTKALTIRAHRFSESAREKIAGAGGTAETLE